MIGVTQAIQSLRQSGAPCGAPTVWSTTWIWGFESGVQIPPSLLIFVSDRLRTRHKFQSGGRLSARRAGTTQHRVPGHGPWSDGRLAHRFFRRRAPRGGRWQWGLGVHFSLVPVLGSRRAAIHRGGSTDRSACVHSARDLSPLKPPTPRSSCASLDSRTSVRASGRRSRISSPPFGRVRLSSAASTSASLASCTS